MAKADGMIVLFLLAAIIGALAFFVYQGAWMCMGACIVDLFLLGCMTQQPEAGWLLLFTLGVQAYFLPLIIKSVVGCGASIIKLGLANTLVGWTGIGWVGLIIYVLLVC